MVFFPLNGGHEPPEGMANLLSPSHIDHMIRQAIQICWMILPKERRSPEEVEAQVRRLVERALEDFREDFKVFGKEGEA